MSPEKPITPPGKFVSFSGVVLKIVPGLEDFPVTETAGWSMSTTRRANPSTRCVLTSMATAWYWLATVRARANASTWSMIKEATNDG